MKVANRLASLDILRGIAVLMVVAVHTPAPKFWRAIIEYSYPARFISQIILLGSYGVDLFFVLSGFLISGLLFHEENKTGKIHFSNFWMRRAFKIFPAYYVAYLIALICKSIIDSISLEERLNLIIANNIWEGRWNFIFLQTYINPENRWFASWSLAVEEHFYLTLPILLAVLLLFKSNQLIVIVLGVICIGLAINRIVAVNLATDSSLIYLQTHYRADALVFGVIIGWFSIYHKEAFAKIAKFRRYTLFFFALALIIPFFYPWGRGITEKFGIPIMYVCFGAVIAIAANAPDLGMKSRIPFLNKIFTVLAYIGFYSYTIYLAQAIMIVLPFAVADRAILYILGFEIGLHGIFFFLGSVIFGIILSRVVEQPCLKLREKIVPKPGRQL